MSDKQSGPRSTAMLTGANSQADTTAVQYPAEPAHVNGNTLSAALKLAADGIPVFPCKLDKKPHIAGGFKNATRDESQIRSWWKQWPQAMIGMPTGPGSGVLVVDIDTAKDGETKDGYASLAKLTAQYGSLPATRKHSTAGGGQHLIFKYPTGREVRNSTSKIAPGIDVRGEGGYIIMPPSANVEGKAYSVEDASLIADAPAWLLDLVALPKTAPGKMDPERGLRHDGQLPPYVRTAIEREISNLASAPEGTRNDTLNKKAFALGQWVDGGYLPEDEAWNMLMPVALSIGLDEDESLKTIESGLLAGMKAPRSVPVSAEGGKGITTGDSLPFAYTVYSCADILTMQPPQWLVKDVLPATGLAAIFGPSRAGKSFLALDLALAITRGEHWFCWLTRACPVLYVNLESCWGLRARLKAWQQDTGHGLPQDLYFIFDPVNLQDRECVRALIQAAPQNGVVIIDTLNRAASGADENSSKDMGNIIKAATEVQTAIDGLVLFVTHSGKDQGRGPRGHSSFFAAMDSVIEVTQKGDARVLKLEKVKEGQDGVIQNFQLKKVVIESEPYSTGGTSCVVEPVACHGGDHFLKPALKYALDSLRKACEAEDATGVHLDIWRPIYSAGHTGNTPGAKQKAFERARKDLVKEGLASVRDDIYSPATR